MWILEVESALISINRIEYKHVHYFKNNFSTSNFFIKLIFFFYLDLVYLLKYQSIFKWLK